MMTRASKSQLKYWLDIAQGSMLMSCLSDCQLQQTAQAAVMLNVLLFSTSRDMQ